MVNDATFQDASDRCSKYATMTFGASANVIDCRNFPYQWKEGITYASHTAVVLCTDSSVGFVTFMIPTTLSITCTVEQLLPKNVLPRLTNDGKQS